MVTHPDTIVVVGAGAHALAVRRANTLGPLLAAQATAGAAPARHVGRHGFARTLARTLLATFAVRSLRPLRSA